MIKRVLIIVALGLAVSAVYVIAHVKPWAIARIKKEITSSLHAKTVTIKDLVIPWRGPIVLSGLVITKNSDLDINVPQITLDKGLWSVIGGSTGKIQLKSFQAQQLKITDVQIDFWWKGGALVFHILEGKVLNGSIQGDIILQISTTPTYRAHIKLANISLPKVISDYKLQQKLSLTGKLFGAIDVSGKGKYFAVINGELTSVHEGGELIINDTQFIRDMVKRMKLDQVAGSEELFVASLKHYLYNRASVKLQLEKKDLVLSADLDGDSGKRSFPIVYHDFNLERLGL